MLCDLGTDCADCGPWKFNVSGDGSSFQADLPIKRLTSQNVSDGWLCHCGAATALVDMLGMPISRAHTSGACTFKGWRLHQAHDSCPTLQPPPSKTRPERSLQGCA